MKSSAGYQYFTAELEIAFWSEAALNDGSAFCKVQGWRHYQNKDPHEAAVECCPILVMPSPTCFTECTEQPCFLFFMFFPVIPSSAASITGKKSCWASQKQNAHRSRTFKFLKSPAGFYTLCSFITRKPCFTLSYLRVWCHCGHWIII